MPEDPAAPAVQLDDLSSAEFHRRRLRGTAAPWRAQAQAPTRAPEPA